MRLLLVQPFYKSSFVEPNVGGMQIADSTFMKFLMRKGFEIYILPWKESHLTSFYLHVDERHSATVLASRLLRHTPVSKGLFLHLTLNWKLLSKPSKLLDAALLDKVSALQKAMDAAKPTIVNVSYGNTDFPKFYRKLGFKLPLVLFHHRHSAIAGIGLYDRVITPSIHMKTSVDATNQIEPENVRVVYPPLLEQYKFCDKNRQGIIFVGSLKKGDRKRLRLLIEVYQKHPEMNDIRLSVIGDGELRECYESTACKERLNIKFFGQASPARVAKMVGEAQILVVPSSGESFGMVYTEALAVGTPIIGFEPTVRELQQMYTRDIGLPFDPRKEDGESLYEKIQALYNESQTWTTQDRRYLAGRTSELFSLRRYNESYLQVLQACQVE